MRFFEFKTVVAEDLPSIVDTVHDQLANASGSNPATNTSTGSTTPAPTTSQGTINTAVGSTGSTPSTLGQPTDPNAANPNAPGAKAPNFMPGQELKMKGADGKVSAYKIAKVDPATKQITLTNNQTVSGKTPLGQPAASTYNIDDILGNIVQ